MSNAKKKMTEDQAVNLIRNSLLVAGEEMGTDGDHWPVITSTVHTLMKEYENAKIERNVDAELKTHLYGQLEIMERGIADCAPEVRTGIALKLGELRELYDAYFSTLNDTLADMDESEIPFYLKRAKAIVSTLEDENV